MRFRISEAIRIAGSLVFILLLFILTAVLVKVPMEEDCFFSVTMATIWFINCKSVCFYVYVGDRCVWVIRCYKKSPPFFPPSSAFGAVLQGSLFGLVGMLPQKYSSIFMSGQGLAGTFAAIAMLIAIGSESLTSTQASSGLLILSCLVTKGIENQREQSAWHRTAHCFQRNLSTLGFVERFFFFSYISVPECFSNSALCVFVTQVKRTTKRQLWVTSSHRVWGRCSHSSATWCCHAWSVSCPLSITALPTIHLTSPIQTLHT